MTDGVTARPKYDPVDDDFEARVRTSFALQAVMATFGVTIDEVGPGWIDLRFAPPPGLTQQDGYLHAGVAATALDSACGYAAMTLAAPSSRVLTSGYKIDLLRPARSAVFIAKARVIKPGNKITVATGELYDSDGKTAAVMTGTIVTLSA